MQWSKINSIAHIALFVLLSNSVCTVACQECTADAPVDTLTDGTLIRTVTKIRVTLIRALAIAPKTPF